MFSFLFFFLIFGIKDYNGALNAKELGVIMKSVSLNVTENELDEMVKEGDTEGNNMIDFPEFVSILTRKTLQPDESQVRNAFKFFDRNSNEHIDAKTLTEILHEVDEIMDESEIQKLIEESRVFKDEDDESEEAPKEPVLTYEGNFLH